MKNFLLFLFLFLTIHRSSSQSSATDYADALRLIDSWIGAQRDYSDLPSIVVAIVKDQEIIWSKAYGLANTDGKVAASTSTLYSICSISKLFTSIAIMQLYDAGKLRLDDIVDSILPNYNLKQQYKESGPITIRSLLAFFRFAPRIRFSLLDRPRFSLSYTGTIERKTR